MSCDFSEPFAGQTPRGPEEPFMRATVRYARLAWLVAPLAVVSLAAQNDAPRMITGQDILAGLTNPDRWLTHSSDYNSQLPSPLTHVTTTNVGQPNDNITTNAASR